jgi:hypothetical protein
MQVGVSFQSVVKVPAKETPSRAVMLHAYQRFSTPVIDEMFISPPTA